MSRTVDRMALEPAGGEPRSAPTPAAAIRTTYALGFGAHLFKIAPNSKRPIEDGWQTAPQLSEAEAVAWVESGGNLGLRTGPKSVIVVDDDQPKHGGGEYVVPQTGLAAVSPTGSRHHYFKSPDPCPRNSASKLAKWVDVRGAGGYVVAPGSQHPAGGLYAWLTIGEPAELPPDVLAVLAPLRAARQPGGRAASGASVRGSRRARAALERESATVSQAAEGSRNDTLVRAAFNLGQLVATGELDRAEVEAGLTDAGLAAGLGESEVATTIRSGIEAGMTEPRHDAPRVGAMNTSPPPKGEHASHEESAPARPRTDVFVPGAHNLPPEGRYIEQGAGTFAAQVLAALPIDALYRRGDDAGEVRAGLFRCVEPDRLRALVDSHVRLCVGKKSKETDGYSLVYRPCTRDHAGLILAEAPRSQSLRKLREIVRTPTLRTDGSVFDAPGYDAQSCTLYAPERTYPRVSENPNDYDAVHALTGLLDPFVQFPFASNSDRAALVAYMLAHAARPAIDGPVPGLSSTSPVWGAGKTMLVDAATVAMTGENVHVTPSPGGRAVDAEAEMRKRIFSVLRAGHRAAMLDNLPDGREVQSVSLATVLTARDYTDRLLGGSDSQTLPARAIWSISGVNLSLHADLARRFLTVRLEPNIEAPESREFKIPDLLAHVHEHHAKLLVAALTILRRHALIGRPSHGLPPLGSFESWDRIVRAAVVWVTDLAGWRADPVATLKRGQADAPDRQAFGDLLTAWAAAFPNGATTAEAVARSNDSELVGALAALGIVDEDARKTSTRLGWALRERAGQIARGLRLDRVGTRHSAAVWKASPIGGGCTRGGEDGAELEPESSSANGSRIHDADAPTIKTGEVASKSAGRESQPTRDLPAILPDKNRIPACGKRDSVRLGEDGEDLVERFAQVQSIGTVHTLNGIEGKLSSPTSPPLARDQASML